MATTKTILQNPKSGQDLFVFNEAKKGAWTNRWKARCREYFMALIPAHLSREQIKILSSQADVKAFLEQINSEQLDVSEIEYLCLVESISDLYEIFEFFRLMSEVLPSKTKILVSNFNWIWFPLFHLTGLLNLTRRRTYGQFLYNKDIECFLEMSGWETVKQHRRFLLPFRVPVLSLILDDLFMRLPLINRLSVNTFFTIRKQTGPPEQEDYTVSIIVPCKNEEQNIAAIVERIPSIGLSTEIIFVNDKSEDRTAETISAYQKQYPTKKIVYVDGPGRGKGLAVRSGMERATGAICMILDADLAVAPEDLPQFYVSLKLRRADFIHGTRMVYPLAKDAMRVPNLFGNLFFAKIFSYIIEQRTTDTLCGTKVYWRKDWRSFEEARETLGNYDIWGDYNLIFGASRFGLKVAQLPVRYYERLEGETKMTRRLREGIIMLKVSLLALWKVKFIK